MEEMDERQVFQEDEIPTWPSASNAKDEGESEEEEEDNEGKGAEGKNVSEEGQNVEDKRKRKKKKKKRGQEWDKESNKWVYITGLPLDITTEEVSHNPQIKACQSIFCKDNYIHG